MNANRTPPHLATLVLLAAFSPLALNMFAPSLAGIAADLETDYATVSLAMSGYLAVTAIIQLIVGPLSDRIGRRPVLLGAILVFAFASAGCALAEDVGTFLFFRMLQGGMTAGYTLSMAIVRDTRSERQAISLIGYIGMSMAIAPMLGPALGGVLDAAFGWRATFVFYAAAGGALWLICWIDLGETGRLGAFGGAGRGRVAELAKEPLFFAFSLCGACSVGGFYIFLTGAPLVAQAEFGVSTAELGIYIGSITLGFMAGGFVTGRVGARHEPAVMMLAGRIVACAGLAAGLAAFVVGCGSPLAFFAATMCVGFGNGVTMPGASAGAMSVRPDLAGSAAGLSSSLIVASGAVLTAATGAVVSHFGGAEILLALMLGVSAAGLCFAIWALRILRRPA